MTGHGPKLERETVITFNEAEDSCQIWTASETVHRRLLKRLGLAFLTEDAERHSVFTFPRKWLILPRIHAKRVIDPTKTPNRRGQFVSRRPV